MERERNVMAEYICSQVWYKWQFYKRDVKNSKSEILLFMMLLQYCIVSYHTPTSHMKIRSQLKSKTEVSAENSASAQIHIETA